MILQFGSLHEIEIYKLNGPFWIRGLTMYNSSGEKKGFTKILINFQAPENAWS